MLSTTPAMRSISLSRCLTPSAVYVTSLSHAGFSMAVSLFSDRSPFLPLNFSAYSVLSSRSAAVTLRAEPPNPVMRLREEVT
jgi:hypothetical protein